MDYLCISNLCSCFICFFVSGAMAFIDILEDYSVFNLKKGLKFKLAFSLLNGLMGVVLLIILWNQVFINTNVILKGLYIGLLYPTFMKSKFLLHDKNVPSDSVSLEKLYNKIISYFNELINDSDRKYITRTKKEIARKNDVPTLYQCAKDAIEDDPWLNKEENIEIKRELLNGIERIKNDNYSEDIKAESLAKFIITNFPGDIPKLLKK